MIIWIRHSDDEHRHQQKYTHDTDLNSNGKKIARDKGREILKKYGIPHIIYCSPFKRTVQTLEEILKNLPQDKTKNIKIIYEPMISRYFSEQEKLNPEVSKSTIKKGIILDKDHKHFKYRVVKFKNNIHKTHENKTVFCITHSTIYKTLAKNYKVKIPDHIPFMDSFEGKNTDKKDKNDRS